MIIKTLNRSEAQNAMKEWVLNYPSLPEVRMLSELVSGMWL